MDGRTNRDVRRWVIFSTIIIALIFSYFYETQAQNETSQQIVVVIPEILRLQVEQSELEFSRQSMNAPYLYPIGGQAGQKIRVFSNVEREWQLQLQSNITNELEWSTDGVTWRSTATGEDTVLTGVRTRGWESHSVYLRLRATESSMNTRIQVAYELTAAPIKQ